MTATEPTREMTYDDVRGHVHKILVIEYFEDKPSAVITDYATFDFDYCKRDDEVTFLNVGSGYRDENGYSVNGFCNPVPPPCKIWAAPEVNFVKWKFSKKPSVPVSEEEMLAMGYLRIAEPLTLKTWDGKETTCPFKAGNESDCHTAYCSICDDNLPEDHLCDHLYAPYCGETIGSGGEEVDQKTFFSMLDILANADDWREWQEWGCAKYKYPVLQAKNAVHALEILLADDVDMDFHPRQIEEVFGDDFDDLESAIGWLCTLGKDTKKANALTLSLIMEWRLTRLERNEKKERESLIADLTKFATSPKESKEILAALGIPKSKKRGDLDKVPTETIRRVLEEIATAERNIAHGEQQ